MNIVLNSIIYTARKYDDTLINFFKNKKFRYIIGLNNWQYINKNNYKINKYEIKFPYKINIIK